jgi:hypothetical protein
MIIYPESILKAAGTLHAYAAPDDFRCGPASAGVQQFADVQAIALFLIGDPENAFPYDAHPAFIGQDVIECLVNTAIAQTEQRFHLFAGSPQLDFLTHVVPFWKKSKTHTTTSSDHFFTAASGWSMPARDSVHRIYP